ncbi:hypothetical protein HDU92_006938 [Lobulomyces angularis]|nr:hypothetical protein HDU92_006938 [Lobulomyces angularis]
MKQEKLPKAQSSGPNWYEQVDLQKLTVADNQLEIFDERICNIESLIYFDGHNNKITSIPESIKNLENLTVLNLSSNMLNSLPSSLFSLNLIELHLANNHINQLPNEIGNFNRLSILDLSNNNISEFPTKHIKNLNCLNKLNLSNNKLKHFGKISHFGIFENLTDLDLSENKITSMFEDDDTCRIDLSFTCPNLTRLDLKKNLIVNFKEKVFFPKLKDFNLSFNKLNDISSDIFENSVKLEILELRDNLLDHLPVGILQLYELKRLDLSNNNISKLNPKLGLLTKLNNLLYVGNPIRGVHTTSTVNLLKSLRDKIPEEVPLKDIATENSLPVEIKNLTIQESRSNTVNLVSQNLLHFPKECVSANLVNLQISKNKIRNIDFFSMHLPNLKFLDISSNHVEMIKNLTSKFVPSLIDLNLSNNKISGAFPFEDFNLPLLNNLIASDNKITVINISKLPKSLLVLDLSNNSINNVPCELGLFKNLQSLVLNGNLFRVPRRQILEKGTEAIKAYLLDKIAQ